MFFLRVKKNVRKVSKDEYDRITAIRKIGSLSSRKNGEDTYKHKKHVQLFNAIGKKKRRIFRERKWEIASERGGWKWKVEPSRFVSSLRFFLFTSIFHLVFLSTRWYDILILLKLREKFISLRFPRSSDSICKFAPPGTNETPCKKSTKVTRDLLRVVRSLKISSYQVRSPFIPTNGSYLPPVSPSIFLPISSQNIK